MQVQTGISWLMVAAIGTACSSGPTAEEDPVETRSDAIVNAEGSGNLANHAVALSNGCSGTLLRNNVRSIDKVGRLGGEEFLVILPEIDAEQAQAVARTLQERIHQFDFDTVLRKTASFGITHFRGDENPQSMLERADRALYRAKANGRDRIEVL